MGNTFGWGGGEYSVDAKKIHRFIGLPMHGEEHVNMLNAKVSTQNEVYGTYSTHQGMNGVVIYEINAQ
jgi:hypothetical protein